MQYKNWTTSKGRYQHFKAEENTSAAHEKKYSNAQKASKDRKEK